LFSDIHANLPSLEACLKSIEEQKPDATYCLGDLVGYNIWANEVINKIKRRKISTIAGNYDFGIGRMSNDCRCAYKTDREKDNGAVSYFFHKFHHAGKNAFVFRTVLGIGTGRFNAKTIFVGLIFSF